MSNFNTITGRLNEGIQATRQKNRQAVNIPALRAIETQENGALLQPRANAAFPSAHNINQPLLTRAANNEQESADRPSSRLSLKLALVTLPEDIFLHLIGTGFFTIASMVNLACTCSVLSSLVLHRQINATPPLLFDASMLADLSEHARNRLEPTVDAEGSLLPASRESTAQALITCERVLSHHTQHNAIQAFVHYTLRILLNPEDCPEAHITSALQILKKIDPQTLLSLMDNCFTEAHPGVIFVENYEFNKIALLQVLADIVLRSKGAVKEKAQAIYLSIAASIAPKLLTRLSQRGLGLITIQTPNSLVSLLNKSHSDPDKKAIKSAIYRYSTNYLLSFSTRQDISHEQRSSAKALALKMIPGADRIFEQWLVNHLLNFSTCPDSIAHQLEAAKIMVLDVLQVAGPRFKKWFATFATYFSTSPVIPGNQREAAKALILKILQAPDPVFKKYLMSALVSFSTNPENAEALQSSTKALMLDIFPSENPESKE